MELKAKYCVLSCAMARRTFGNMAHGKVGTPASWCCLVGHHGGQMHFWRELRFEVGQARLGGLTRLDSTDSTELWTSVLRSENGKKT